MDKKIIATLLIALITIVSVASLSYYVASQPNQTQNNTAPTPTPTPTPTPSPSEEPTETSSIPKPSVPEFTIKIVDNSYDVPTTYSVDQYTGKTITHEGYHVENKSIEVTIKNQNFTPCRDAEGHEIKLYYSIRVKGHFGDEWTAPTPFQNYDSTSRIPVSSSSGYTVVTCSANYPADTYLDFQVAAFAGHYYYEPGIYGLLDITSGFEVDENSGWSNTQTITIP